jgi:two-component system, NtrC family, response regulator AtoC
MSDIHMPIMDGHELLRRIKSDSRLTKIIVIFLTGFGDVKDAVESMRNGAHDYLLKPFNLDEMEMVVQKVEEYLVLREENIHLRTHFRQEVDKAVGDVKRELDELRRVYIEEIGKTEVLVKSASFRKVVETAKKLHRHPEVPVHIEGETGTGKEIIARLVHGGESGTTKPFVGLNCAIITPSLFESELFGYEPGAFTGGNPKGQAGKIELAEGGAIFLDEITELPINFQAKLLRVIQEREYYRVGGVKTLTTNARFICATNQNIRQKVDEGLFREDLFFRLNVGYIQIPPLRERREEILPLCYMFMNQLAKQGKTKLKGISNDAAVILENHSWPGNVREIKNTIERLSLFCEDTEIMPCHLQNLIHKNTLNEYSQKMTGISTDPELPDEGLNLDSYLLKIVEKALLKNDGNKTATARYLGISLRTLHTYLKHLMV